MTLLLAQVYEEALRCAYALSSSGAGGLAVDAAVVALMVAFTVTGWRLLSAPRTERRDEACRS